MQSEKQMARKESLRKKRKRREAERAAIQEAVLATPREEHESNIRFKNSYLDSRVSQAQEERRARREAERERRLANQKTPEEKRKIAIHRLVVLASILAMVAIAAVIGNTATQVFDLMSQKEEAQARLDAVTKNRDQLQEELNNVNTNEYVEQNARSELRMIYPGEVLYIMPGSEEPETAGAPEDGQDAEGEGSEDENGDEN